MAENALSNRQIEDVAVRLRGAGVAARARWVDHHRGWNGRVGVSDQQVSGVFVRSWV